MIKFLASIVLSLTLFAEHTHTNDIPARLQWFPNAGYCGEMSLISAGLYYGQYLSQYDVRALVTQDGSQTNGSLLIGVNASEAAKKMRLTYEDWDPDLQENTDQFLIWMKQHIVAGHPVAFGVYANQYIFNHTTDPNAGDPDYDHIVSATVLASHHFVTDPSYYGDDEVGFNDNGYFDNQNTPVYFFTYDFQHFPASRQEANNPNGPIYALSNDGANYGIAITGVADLNQETLPVRIETNFNDENPPIVNGSNQRPLPMPLTLKVTISGLDPNTTYNLYRYDNLAIVPDSAFNANARAACQKWTFKPDGSTHVLMEKIQSDEQVIYRCVASSAP
ncbi:MAG: hypothetical protein KGQ49_00660 [Verrucomicrobia bacterium]|nr:hypothetical protein [Verrucomicrobiota bacterium]MBU6445892.1 hypothetical protein [Verrucomicrobiota bacterium]MDE3046727.1 hypothetical protein [Verrucomicrobiota bacterium]